MLSQVPSNLDIGYSRYKTLTTYDGYFSKYSKRYFGIAFDWHYFKAQAVAESNLRSDAESPVGAQGLMQIMPNTYREIRHKNPTIAGTVDHPRWNIAAGIWYDRDNFVAWTAKRSLVDRIKFMFGSYNAGRGNILNAQRLAINDGLNATSWSSIEKSLPDVTGTKSEETLTYVTRIFQIKKVLH